MSYTENVSPILTVRGSYSPTSNNVSPALINSRYNSPKKALKPFKISDMHIKINGTAGEQQLENSKMGAKKQAYISQKLNFQKLM